MALLSLVKKSDASLRPCTDYRKVNSLSKPDLYPLPRIEDCVAQVGSAMFVRKFDLLKGYWQVPLTKRTQEISGYITPSCLYSHKVMPFGLRSAPATFQRLMNYVVSGLNGCSVFLDDNVGFSGTWEEHIQRIGALFDRLAWAHLPINLAKCEFVKATVTYLGRSGPSPASAGQINGGATVPPTHYQERADAFLRHGRLPPHFLLELFICGCPIDCPV